VNSVTTEQFRQLYTQAPLERRRKIRRAYQRWQENPAHPSLRFKKVHTTLPIYSARVDLDWRAVGVLKGAPSASKVVTPVNSILGGLMEQLNDCLQLGCSC